MPPCRDPRLLVRLPVSGGRVGRRVGGYGGTMTDNANQNPNADLRHDVQANETVQAVEDRVLSWQAGAPVETVREELRRGLAEVGEAMPDAWLQETAQRISTADPAQRS